MLKLFRFLDEKIFFPYRFSGLSKILAHYIEGKKVLDVGSYSGELAFRIKEETGIEFIGVDVNIPSKIFIPTIKYDGKKLPFKSNSFDTVMMIDVLHHTKNHDRIIKEAKRVSKKYVLIKDHYYDNKIDFLFLKCADYIGNKPYGISLPYNFLSIKSWQKLIKKNNLKILETKKFRLNFFDPCKHIIFKLAK